MGAVSAPVPVEGAFGPDSASTIHIAVAQILPSAEGLAGAGGLPRVSQLAAYAAAQGADVIVFPEYFSGATHDAWRAVRQTGPTAAPADESALDEGHWLAAVQALAREHNINIVAGTVVEAHPEGAHDGPLYNTAYCVSRHGRIAGRYTKRNLWHPERVTLTPGTDATHADPVTFELDTRRSHRFTAAMAICWDMAWPEVFRRMITPSPDGTSMAGPDVVFLPTCWYGSDASPVGLKWNKNGEAHLLDSLVFTRAIETEAVMVLANISGPPWPGTVTSNAEAAAYVEQGGFAGVGRSSVAAPFLGPIGRIDHPDEALLLSSVDLNVLKDAREVFRSRYDLCAANASEK